MGDSGAGLPPGLAVLSAAGQIIGTERDPATRRGRRTCAVSPGLARPAAGGDLPVHERDHRHAQGHLAARGSAVPRRRRRGRPPPADPGRPGLLLSPAVPRQRRGGRIARDPGRGACLVLDRKFSRRRFWELIEARRITWINAVPAIIAVLAMDPPAARPGGRVRFVRSASAPLPPSTLRRFEEAFGIPVIETYGMTEAASMITANPLDGPRKAGSAGRPAGTEVRVGRAAAGSRYVLCPALVVGRVQIRGRGVIREYAEGGPAGCHRPRGLARHRRPRPPRPGRLPVPGRAGPMT